MESDADRLASIKSLGGQLVSIEAGDFWAVFDAAGVESSFGDARVNSTSPRLTLRTSDVTRFSLEDRGAPLIVEGQPFTVREHQRGDAPGWSVLVLDEV